MAEDAGVIRGQPVGRQVEAGGLPRWEVAELPAPPPYSFKNALRVAGAGAIILGAAIGSGEWLIGPAVTAQFTAALLWDATISILLRLPEGWTAEGPGTQRMGLYRYEAPFTRTIAIRAGPDDRTGLAALWDAVARPG